MRKILGSAALRSLPIVFMLWAAVAGAQSAVVIRGSQAPTSPTGAVTTVKVDANGVIQGTEALGLDRNQFWVHPNIMNNLGVQEDNADSSAAFSTLGWTHMSVLLYPRVDADSIKAALLKVRVHKHFTQSYDTTTAFPWQKVKPGGTAGPDTVGSFLDAYNTDNLGNIVDYSDILVLVKVRPGGNQPQGWAIDLVDPRTGAWFSAAYTSVKITVVETYGASFAALAAGPTVRWRADLVGWR